MRLHEWLLTATTTLKEGRSLSARLDALLLASGVLRHNKAWLLAHGDYELAEDQLKTLDALLRRRVGHEPLAYIAGHQEFYGRSFIVTPSVLIPRPETEPLISALLELPIRTGDKLLDIGTGSGCIAITLALEAPQLHIFAVDMSKKALAIAQLNASQLNASVTFAEQNLLANDVHGPYHYIVANLPYVDRDWERSLETAFEPAEALFAANHGLADIEQLIAQAPSHMVAGGYLVLEADPRQHRAIIATAKAHHYQLVRSMSFALVLRLTS
jgi:release factor glutamine methyltransferase